MDKQKNFEKGWEEYKATRKQEVGEMAKTLCANCRKDGYSCSLYSSDDDWVCVQERERAEHLYNAGYRKIPENAVVLTREELTKEPYNEFCKGCPNARTKSSGIIACEADYNCQQFTRYANLLDNYKQLEQKNCQLEQNLKQCENGYELELHTARCQVHFMEEDIEKFKQNLKQSRKETAEKFAERLKAQFPPRTDKRCTLDDCYMLDKIDEICKEIVEGKNG